MLTLRQVVATLLPITVIAIAVSAAGQSPPPSGRHGDGHAQHHDWYEDLRQPDTRSRCCSGTVDGKQGDCRPTQSYLGEDGLYRAWDGREWLVVPKSKMIFMTTPDGGTHLCETYGRVFCFILGDPQS